ncbi:murein biosynthesis integral membrane protein MurJ [Hephaestia sp. GCM10023244]|uniref:murein biosynthesis integral membrane protein MurJ n=1 Tax=unclassified Hephaestia TaxID=2631281 RepID=UPI002076FA07|nr:murein biosynthesis integral membrane protein MurJ [Hephaestia sp. MAHUQ-44]MCM8729957.1 murein biosynthesis integral membrane protein MurJ [Hephaestia sp. MAHUQ-44]
MSLLRSLGSVGGLTLVSRVLALGRDTLQAAYVGAGFASDAFFVAFRLPNMFRALFAEGAFAAAFIPMFNRKVGEEGDIAAGLRFAEQALAVLFPLLVIFTLVMLAAAWPVTAALSGGFAEQQPSHAQFAFAVTLSRFTIPYLMLISLASLLGGILNSIDKFWANAAAPILLNIAMIVALLFFHGDNPYQTALAQAVSVSVGGVFQLGWLMLVCRAAGVSLKLRRPRLTPEIRQLMTLIIPAAAGAGAAQINLAVSTALAGGLLDEGAISALYYADRLNQLPLGLIGIGLGTILLPTVSRLLGSGRESEAMVTQNRGIELALFLTLPATAAFIAASGPIVSGLFERGHFDAADTVVTSWALAAFSIGLPSYVLIKVLTPGFYARADTRTPVRYAIISIGVNIVANLILIPTIGTVGPPLATALASTINVYMLYRTLGSRGHFIADPQLRRRLPRLVLAAALMGIALYFGQALVEPFAHGSLLKTLPALGVFVLAGIAIYALACFVTGAFRPADLKAVLRRRPAA